MGLVGLFQGLVLGIMALFSTTTCVWGPANRRSVDGERAYRTSQVQWDDCIVQDHKIIAIGFELGAVDSIRANTQSQAISGLKDKKQHFESCQKTNGQPININIFVIWLLLEKMENAGKH